MWIAKPFAAGALICLVACGGGGSGSTPPPTITTQPASQTVNAGSGATFKVAASDATSYQWDRNGQPIAGATSASYTLSPATSANNGDSYTVIVSNAGGSLTSSAAALRVTGVSVVAGQIGGQGYVDGPAAQAGHPFTSGVGAVYSMTATHVPTLLADTGLSNRLPAIVMGGDGNLYVGDVANSVILQVTPSGAVTAVAGSPALPIATVLGGLPARINSPSGLALLSKGSPVSLAVVDSFEHAILRVDLP